MAHESRFAKVLRLAREKREAMPEHTAFQHTERLTVTKLSSFEMENEEDGD
jgi:hypothetical protein